MLSVSDGHFSDHWVIPQLYLRKPAKEFSAPNDTKSVKKCKVLTFLWFAVMYNAFLLVIGWHNHKIWRYSTWF